MHKESLELMKIYLGKYASTPCTILDVGSLNVKNKGCYKQIIPGTYSYLGIDLVEGPNVDIVLDDPYGFPFDYEVFDVVISGQTFEHTKNPFRLMDECAAVLKPGGYFIGVAPMAWDMHHRPDCWRILPDGWDSLFENAGLTKIETHINVIEEPGFIDCWGIAQK